MSFELGSLPEPLFEVLQHYASLGPPRLLTLPLRIPFTQFHDFVLQWIILNPHFLRYPPSSQYRSSFLKRVVCRLEELATGEDIEIDERIYANMICIMPRSSLDIYGTSPPAQSYVTYIWKAPTSTNNAVGPGIASATLLESRTLIENGTTGLKTWTASLVLAEFLIAHPDLVQNKCVLELGCGAGFLGIIAATLQMEASTSEGGSDRRPALWLTDVNDAVLERCQHNINLPCNVSSHHSGISCRILDWSDALDTNNHPSFMSLLSEIGADVIIGADIVYDPSIIPDFVSALHLALITGQAASKRDTTAYVALTVRNETTHEQFLCEAGRLLKVDEVGADVVSKQKFTAEASGDQEVKIYQITIKL